LTHGLGNPTLQPYESEGVEIELKYSGYIKRQEKQIEHTNRQEHRKLSQDLDYSTIQTLSMEAREKLNRIKPLTIGQASRIGGVNPADINALLVYLETTARLASTAP
jgi:tRNA uridine 5-carboxymethylaminomethyl modification enzyme